MAKYEVFWQTLCTWRADVEADTPEGAKEIVQAGKVDPKLVAEEDPLDHEPNLYGAMMVKEIRE